MKFSIEQALLLALLTSSTHWSVARSSVFEPLWSRARGRLDRLLRCAACSGYWLGIAAGALGVRPVTVGYPPIDILLAGLLAVWLTPVAEGVLMWGLERAAIPHEPIGEAPACDRCRHNAEVVRFKFEDGQLAWFCKNHGKLHGSGPIQTARP